MPASTTWLDGRRFAASLAVSGALHLSLMFGVPVRTAPGSGAPGTPRAPLTVALSVVQSADSAPPLQAASPPAMPEPARPEPIAQAPAVPAAIPLPLPETHYYALSELDTPPVVLDDIPTDPPELRQYPQGGKLVVQLWIDETGHVVRAESLASELPEAFAASARDNFLSAVFAPARKDGVAVRSRVKVGIYYRPRQIPP